MGRYFINGIGCVSAQETSDTNKSIQEFEALTSNVVSLHKPDYKKYIQPAMIRRMSVGVKMGVVASSIALEEGNIQMPDAIVTGSGMGCLRDSEKFLRAILDNDEQFLTPTAFIQSTHNTVGAQIALGLGCKNYNVTYVHDATSFESSLIDGMMILNDGEENVLVGGVDEIGSHTTDMHKLIGYVKNEEIISPNLLHSKTPGSIYSEGAQFFVVENQQKTTTYAQLVDVAIYNELEIEMVVDKLNEFLKEQALTINDIDVVVLGNNGDSEYDSNYSFLQERIFKETPQLYYKHMSGEYNTVNAFAMWAACKIIKDQRVPENLQLNNLQPKSIKNLLIYNQYRGKNHSFILLSSC